MSTITVPSHANPEYQVLVAQVTDTKMTIQLPGDIESNEMTITEEKRPETVMELITLRDLMRIFPHEFEFDFFLTLDQWRDNIIGERRNPTDTQGLTREGARLAWSLLDHWESLPIDNLGDYLEVVENAENDMKAFGYNELEEEDQQALLAIFSTPIKMKKPSMAMIHLMEQMNIRI